MHLLAPAVEELGSPCLSPKWQEYDYAFALAMAAVLAMFFAEVAAYRLGTARLLRLGVRVGEERDEARGSDVEAPANKPDPLAKPVDCDEAACAEPDCIEPDCGDLECCDEDNDSLSQPPSNAEAAAQLIAIGVLEFGIVLHSVIIGLTLAVSDEFIVLFVVIIFHRTSVGCVTQLTVSPEMFEGPGLGSRLATLPLPKSAGWIRYAGAILYAACTPIGIAVGLGLREGFNGNSGLFNAVAGILDSLSAGILIYTGLVELLAHEVLFNPRMMAAETRQLAYVLGCIALGAGMMALLAKWA